MKRHAVLSNTSSIDTISKLRRRPKWCSFVWMYRYQHRRHAIKINSRELSWWR